MLASRREFPLNKHLAVYGKPRYLGFVEYEKEIEKGSTIVAESYRGEETALIVGSITTQQEAKYRLLRNASEHGDSSNKTTEPVVTDLQFLRKATDEEIEASITYRKEEKEILKKAIELSVPHNLDMKLIDVEFLLNKRKLFFYFSSEQRIDFRAYVRDLAREFKTRIELRQIGVRDEAKVIGGIGPCGQSCCCSYWLNQFAPICIKMVKEQNLALNPAKISGICGRLMCCMSFEHEVYHELWKKLPNPGSKIKTPTGNVIITGIELHKENVRCFIPGKGEVKVSINKFEEFKTTMLSGEEWVVEEYIENLSTLTEKPLNNLNPNLEEQSNINFNKPHSYVENSVTKINKRKKRRFKNNINLAVNKTNDNTNQNGVTDEITTDSQAKIKTKYAKFKKNRSKRKINNKNKKNIIKQENKI